VRPSPQPCRGLGTCWDTIPTSETQLHTEVDTVLNGRIAEHHDIPKLVLTSRIITETLRLYPPGWMFTRLTTANTELAGQHLPAGTIVVFSIVVFSPYVLTSPLRPVP
jgi:cytochrome P450